MGYRIGLLVTICIMLIFSCKPSEKGKAKKRDATFYQNPVHNLDFPDPTVIRANDGSYYAYATQAVIQNDTFNIQVAKSTDMVNWKFIGDALPQRPEWAKTTQEFWAPHASYDSMTRTYYLYYSGESDDKQTGKCLGVATSKNPQGPFVDSGKPLICGTEFVNIDPMAFDDPKTGKKLLYWGSGFLPVKVQELSDDRLRFKENTIPLDLVLPGKDSDYNILIEGAWVSYREGKYYLFYSGDNCCGKKANYAVMVARADHAQGPFTRLGETNESKSSTILIRSEEWNAPGHNSIIVDEAGNDWIFYHAIMTSDSIVAQGEALDRNDKRVMLLDRVYYKDGWPYVKDRIPSSTKLMAPVTR